MAKAQFALACLGALLLTSPTSACGTTAIALALNHQPVSESVEWSVHHLDQGRATDVFFSPTGPLLATAEFNGRLRLWDFNTQKLHAQSQKKHSQAWYLNWNREGTRLVSFSDSDRTVRVYEGVTLQPLGEIQVERGRFLDLAAFVPQSDVVALLTTQVDRPIPQIPVRMWRTDRSEVLLWDIHRRSPISIVSAVNDKLSFRYFTLSVDGRFMAVWYGPDAYLFDISARSAATRKGTINKKAPILNLQFSKDAKSVVMFDRDNSVTTWDVESGAQLRQFRVEFDNITADHLGDGEIGAFGDDRGAVEVWDLVAGKSIKSLAGHTDRLLQIAFTRNREWLAAATARHINMWETSSGRLIGRCAMQGYELLEGDYTLTISFDGRAVAVSRNEQRGVTLCRAGGTRP